MPKQANRRAADATPEDEALAAGLIAEEEANSEATHRQADQVTRRLRTLQALLARLRSERERQGLSLADMQLRTGMSRGAICNLENVRRVNPTVQTLARYAEALGLELDLCLRPAPPE